jgi:arylsulfatase
VVLDCVTRRRWPTRGSRGERLDVGIGVGSPVDFTYTLPFAFTGKIEKVMFELK